MIELTQEVNNLIGSRKAVDSLAKKETARILTISDSHGNYSIFSTIVKKFGGDCDALIFSGDGIRDLAALLAEQKTNPELQKTIPPVIAFVCGNNDPSSMYVDDSTKFTVPDNQVLTVCNQNIFVTHGHRQGVDFGWDVLAFDAQMSNCKIAVYGHTHLSGEDFFGKDNDYKFINAGSCSRPRGGLPPSFAILTVTKKFEDTAFVEIKKGSQSEPEFGLFTPIY